MKAVVDAKEFSQALNKVIKALKPSAVPVLAGVLVQIKDGLCTMTASDWSTWLTTAIPAEGDDLGFVFQHPKDTARACGHFEGRLTLEVEDKNLGKGHWIKLTMSCGPRVAQIETFSSEEYPSIPKNRVRQTYMVNAARLLERVEHISYMLVKPGPATGAQSTHVQFKGNQVYALDGYRLAWDMDDSLTVQQPFMALPEALGYLKFFGDQEVTASVGENYLQLSDGMTMIQTRIEGPLVFNMDGAVPKKFLEEFCVSPKEFLKELDYLKQLVRSTDKANIRFSGGRLYLPAASGNYSTQIQIDGTSNIDFGFDLRYMIDALRQFRGEARVKMKVISPMAPIVLEAEGRGDSAMVLPVRISAAAAA